MADHKFRADDARALLSSIGQIQLCAIHPNGLSVKGKEFGTNIEAALEWAEACNGHGNNVYWTPNWTRPGVNKKPAKSDIMAARWCFVDIDPPKTGGAFDKVAIADALNELAAPPSMIIDSGGGLNAYWRLDEPCENLASIENINIQIRDYFTSDNADNCWNADRIMRLPGTVNYPDKRKLARGRVPVLAKILSPDDGTVYEPHVLSAAFPPAHPTSTRAGATGANNAQVQIAMPDGVVMETPDTLGLGILDPLRSAINEPPAQDRSGDGVAAARLMANAGMVDAQILGVLLNPANPVAGHYVDQRDPKRAALRTLQLVRSDGPPEGEELQPAVPMMSQADMDIFLANMRAKVKQEMVPSALSHDATTDKKAVVHNGKPAWLAALDGNPIGRFVDHVCATAASPQPWVTLGAALAVFGTAAGRRYAGPTNLRTNLYCIGICDSGGGKDHPIKMATELMVDAGQQKKMGGSKIASGQAMLTDLTNNPALMYAIDEVGFLISSAADRKRAPKHSVDIIDNLTFLYSQAGSTFLGTSYADQSEKAGKPRQVIEQPCLSLFGVTTPSVFWGSLSSANVLDGSLARMVIFQSDNNYPDPQYDIERTAMPASVVMAIQRIVKGAEGHNPLPMGEHAAVAPKPYTVPYADDAAKMYARLMRDEQTVMLREHEGTSQTSIIARLAENAAKIALTRAVAANPEAPTITKADLEWGVMIARQSVDSLMQAVKERVADNEQEAKLKKLQNIIAQTGAKGIEHEVLFKIARFMGTRRMLVDALDFLAAGGSIGAAETARNDGKGGKPKRVYFSIE